MTAGVDWRRLRPGTDIRRSFEDLCCRLANLEGAPPGSEFRRLAPPDGGVECIWRLPDGSEWGWQAKYFLTAPDSSQWRQIDKSVRSALRSRARLVRYVVCTPADRTKSGDAKWDALVEEWRAIKPIKYEYWGGHELESLLTDGRKQALLKYYFDKEFLSPEWAKAATEKAIANAGPRYTPEQNIDLPVGNVFHALCGTSKFFGRLEAAATTIRESLSDASTRPALDAAADEFAKLDTLANAIAAMLADHDAHKRNRIPTKEIRKKSSEAMAIISDIASRLSNENLKNKPGDAAHHYRTNVFGMEQDRLQRMYDALDYITDGKLSKDAEVYNAKALLVAGEAGVGKTHLFCDIARGSTARRQMAALLHGSHFGGGSPQETIIKELDLDCTFSEFLGGLDEAGRASGSRSLLMIDALNEGAGKDTWKSHIRGLLHEVSRFPHVALAGSVRTPYVPEVVPDDIDPAALRRIEHRGFGSRTEDALAMFFDNNGIDRPSVPVITPEFSNPQFLTILCKGLLNKKCTSMPEEIDGIAAVYDFFIDSVNDKLSSGDELQIPREFKIVQRAVDAVARRLAAGDGESLEFTEAYRLLNDLDSDLPNLGRLLDALISEGVLGTYTTRPQKGAGVKRVRFAYERMSDNLIIKSRLDEAATADNAAAMLKGGGPLAAYVDNPARHRGLVDALSAQLPERFRKELLEMYTGAPKEDLTASFLESLLWRSPRSIGSEAVRLVDRLIKERRQPDRALKALLTHSANPNSPLNADYLHRHLLGLEMGDRDQYLATFLHRSYTTDYYSIVASYIGWAKKEGRKSSYKAVRLAGMTLGWFLTASNRSVRDRSTKALVSMFADREGALVDVMSEFRDCNDPYVAERLYCAAYGCAMQSKSSEGLKRLATYAYDDVFKSGSPPPDIMLRDYARGIVLLARHRGIRLGVNFRACSPPHTSDWIANFPTESYIASLNKACQEGSDEDGVASILCSLSRMGDFYRYVIGESNHGCPWINAKLPKDKTTWKEALCAFDESVTREQQKLWAPLKSMLSGRVRAGTVVDPQTGKPAPTGSNCTALVANLAHEIKPLLSAKQAAAFDGRVLPCLEYSLDPYIERYRFDAASFARWIVKRVFDLGWTADRFENHDAALGSGSLPQDGAERIGKKYQWIAYHELLARLSDNFEFSSPSEIGLASTYESTSQLQSKRDIDPSMPYYATTAEAPRPVPCGSRRADIVYNRWGVIPDDADWLKDTSDLPSFGKILTVSDGSGANWLVLDVSYSADQRPAERVARTHPHRRIEMWAKSAIVPKKDGPALAEHVCEKDLGSLKFPDPEDHYGPFLGELYWAHLFHVEGKAGAPPDAAIELGGPDHYVKAHRTTRNYYAERGSKDFSLKNNISILVPASFLAKGLKLVNMCDGTFADACGDCMACDAAAGDTGSNALLFRQEPLAEFLKSNGYEIFWHTAACKRIIRGLDAPGGGSPSYLAVNSVYRMQGDSGPELVRSAVHEE